MNISTFPRNKTIKTPLFQEGKSERTSRTPYPFRLDTSLSHAVMPSLTSGGADDKQVRESPALLPPDTDDETDGCQSATTHVQ